jgi:TatD DNase family protein
MSDPNESRLPATPSADPEGVRLPEPGGFDAHTHMDILGLPVDGVLDAARALGIGRVVNVGCDLPSSHWSVAAAAEYADVYAAVAIHPNETAKVDGRRAEVLAELAALAASPKVVAVGETGLDYYRDYAPVEDQRRAFEAQVELARDAGKPLVIHTRAAEDDTLALLGDRAGGLDVVMHCFSMPDRLGECVSRGYWISFAGNVTYPSAADLADAARRVPADRLLVETDAPFLSPQPVRGKPNKPVNVTHTARFLAEARGVSYEELEATVEANATSLFRW